MVCRVLALAYKKVTHECFLELAGGEMVEV